MDERYALLNAVNIKQLSSIEIVQTINDDGALLDYVAYLANTDLGHLGDDLDVRVQPAELLGSRDDFAVAVINVILPMEHLPIEIGEFG